VRGAGAAGIWNILSDQFPQAIRMVDRLHVQQHSSDLGESRYGPMDSRAAPWAKRRQKKLDAGQFRTLLTAIRRHVARSEEARRACPIFRPIESGCAIRSSMHRASVPPPVWWTPDASGPSARGTDEPKFIRLCAGSNAIIALRRSKLSRPFEDFCKRSSERRAA